MAGTVYAAIIRRIIDAGRLDIACDYNPDRRCSQRVRLAGLRTPRPGTPDADAATAWVHTWLAEHAPATPPAVWVTISITRPVRFARYPAIIHAPDGACLNRDIIHTGHATPL